MAGRKENLKSLFTNTRTRVIIIFTTAVLAGAVTIGLVKFISSSNVDSSSSVNLRDAPQIDSVPGALEPTAQYASLQEEQNITQAQKALQKGGSAIPTIIRTQTIGSGSTIIGPQSGEGGVGFSTLAQQQDSGMQQSLWVQSLKDNFCSKTAATQVINEGGHLIDLKKACSCLQLKDIGYQLVELNKVCSCKELKAAGFNARELKTAAYSSSRLRDCGFNACELHAAGFTAQEMKDGNFSDGELKGAGFPEEEIARASGVPNAKVMAEIRQAGCSAMALQTLRASGISAGAIKRVTGCSADQLKAGGFSAKDLNHAGFSAAELAKAGWTPAQLKQGGYSARDLLNAGFTPKQLAGMGYSPDEIAQAEAELPPGITADDIKKAGCSIDALGKQRLAGVSAKLIRTHANCTSAELKAAGFTDNDLANAGFSKAQIAAAKTASDLDSPAKQLKQAEGISDAAIQAAGCDPLKLAPLLKGGVSAKQIKTLNGCTAAALKQAGADLQTLTAAGFTPDEFITAGFTPAELAASGFPKATLIAAGRKADCSEPLLKTARAEGIAASTIKNTLGCNAASLSRAGYDPTALKAAGFTAAELKTAAVSLQNMQAAGFDPKELREAGFTANELKTRLGSTAKELLNAGFSAAELQTAGFTPSQLKLAGYTDEDLKEASLSATTPGSEKLNNASAGSTNGPNTLNQGASENSPDSQVAGLPPGSPKRTEVAAIPSIQKGLSPKGQANFDAANSRQLQKILTRQNKQFADQRLQQKIQQRTSQMVGAANDAIKNWEMVATQQYTSSGKNEENPEQSELQSVGGGRPQQEKIGTAAVPESMENRSVLIKTGDVLFAVMDTSVNSDEPGPILATIVSGQFKGARLIGSFHLSPGSDEMIINFNVMSVRGAQKSTPISAYAIDPNTARTALSSRTNHHYLMRYGSLFAASFLEGFGNAFQSANTTVTIGGTAGGDNVTVQNGIGRSTLENAVIGMATLGKTWGQVAQQKFNTPATVEVYSGTPMGILFTQDLTSL